MTPAAAQPQPQTVLGPSVAADLEALRNDMEQAREMASDYQRQLAGKSNDFADLKCIFEKTSQDLEHLRTGIAQLREERHQLANDAMRAMALDLKVKRITADRDRLQEELGALKDQHARETDERVVQLTAEVERLRRERKVVAATPAPETAGAADYIPIAYANGATEQNITILPAASDPINAARRFRRALAQGAFLSLAEQEAFAEPVSR